MDKLYSISDLSRDLGTTPRSIRYYEEQGLLSPQRAGATRIYTQRDRGRLVLILRGKRLGFSLKDIQEYLDLYDADPTQDEQINTLLRKVRGRIGDLEEQLGDLRTTIGELREIEALALAAMGHRAREPAPGGPGATP
jgi:DNA-binding transcriptional MerR regulator